LRILFDDERNFNFAKSQDKTQRFVLAERAIFSLRWQLHRQNLLQCLLLVMVGSESSVIKYRARTVNSSARSIQFFASNANLRQTVRTRYQLNQNAVSP
jgi:hypothetical protein